MQINAYLTWPDLIQDCIYIRTHIYIHMHTYAYIHTCASVIVIHTFMHAYTRTQCINTIDAYLRMFLLHIYVKPTHIYIYVHIYVKQAHIYTYISVPL